MHGPEVAQDVMLRLRQGGEVIPVTLIKLDRTPGVRGHELVIADINLAGTTAANQIWQTIADGQAILFIVML